MGALPSGSLLFPVAARQTFAQTGRSAPLRRLRSFGIPCALRRKEYGYSGMHGQRAARSGQSFRRARSDLCQMCIRDRAYTSFWQSRTNEKPHLEFQTPEGESAQYLYICFAEMPEAWSIEEEINGEWQTSIEGTTDYYHVLDVYKRQT